MQSSSLFLDFQNFSNKLDSLREIICEIHDEFVHCTSCQGSYKLTPNEILITKWAEWQNNFLTESLSNGLSSFITVDQLIETMMKFEKVVIGTFGDENNWLNGNFKSFFCSSKLQDILWIRQSKQKYFILNKLKFQVENAVSPPSDFFFYLQKGKVSVGTNLILWGDIHGSIHSLCRSLEPFIDSDWKITRSNTILVFLGDFIDRGIFGLETLYVLFTLKIQNPNKVFVLRGDHELPNFCLSRNSFIPELEKKLGIDWIIYYKAFAYLFNLLPVAVYLQVQDGKNRGSFIQLSHGGVDLGFLPTPLLSSVDPISFYFIDKIEPENNLHLLNSPQQSKICFLLDRIKQKNMPHLMSPMMNGFIWGDFLVDEFDEFVTFTFGRGFAFGKEVTRALLKASSPSEEDYIRVIFRGHQHSELFLWELIYRKGLFP